LHAVDRRDMLPAPLPGSIDEVHMNAVLVRVGALSVFLFTAGACSQGNAPGNDEQGPGHAEPALTQATGAGASANGAGSVDRLPPNARCGEDDIACQETTYQLEETLFLYEGAVAKAVGEAAQSCWRDDVAAFRRALDDCGDPDCRHARLRERLASLSDLQPPATRAAIALPPRVPLLLAVLGPEEATEADDETAPLEARGDLVLASTAPEHMGVAVRDGRREHVIVFDMDIGNQPGHDGLMGLVGTSPTTRVLVRGYRRMAPDGVANFDPGRCRQVYQLVR
jgi:hypothetical protein